MQSFDLCPAQESQDGKAIRGRARKSKEKQVVHGREKNKKNKKITRFLVLYGQLLHRVAHATR